MISLRVWLERFPYQVRFCIALLAMLSFVAPTWHVCSLGGHVMESDGGAQRMAGMNHIAFEQSKSGALICFCAAKPREQKPATPLHTSHHTHEKHDANCLALILCAMPALLVSSFRLPVVSGVSFRLFSPRRESAARQFIRTFCGRGPPVMLVG